MARWAEHRLVNRNDVYGRYLAPEERVGNDTARTHKGEPTREVLARHFRGQAQGDLIGLHVVSSENTCLWVLIDIDHHGQPDPERQKANRKAAIKLDKRLRELGFSPLLSSSNGIGGYHVMVVFSKPVPATVAHAFGKWLTRGWKDLGLAERPEAFPKQPKLSAQTPYGNWVRLPGRHHTRKWHSQVWLGDRWGSGAEAVAAILKSKGDDPSLIPDEAREYREEDTGGAGNDGGTRRPVRSARQGTPTQKVLERLKGVRDCGSGWSARCPGHKELKNSLSINEGDDGRVLLYCHAGCPFERIVEGLGMEVREMFAGRQRRRALKHPRKEGT